jgi:hypothetical protein
LSIPEIFTVGFELIFWSTRGGPILLSFLHNNLALICIQFSHLYQICDKPLITSEPCIGKFQILAEMKLNYHTNKKNTHRDFSDNFYNIKHFVQMGRIEKIINISWQKPPTFSLFRRSRETPRGRKIFPIGKIECIYVPDYCVHISGKSNHHALQNMYSNPTVKISGIDNK